MFAFWCGERPIYALRGGARAIALGVAYVALSSRAASRLWVQLN